eukprot:scaffold332233_cov39-Prasinocladus_malaysianus.AAC.1
MAILSTQATEQPIVSFTVTTTQPIEHHLAATIGFAACPDGLHFRRSSWLLTRLGALPLALLLTCRAASTRPGPTCIYDFTARASLIGSGGVVAVLFVVVAEYLGLDGVWGSRRSAGGVVRRARGAA